jgi:hypothetical protein
MPEALREAVGMHHEPNKAERYPLEAATIHFADILAHALELGSSGERFVPPLSAGAWTRLGIGADMVDFACEELDRQYAASVHLLGLGSED